MADGTREGGGRGQLYSVDRHSTVFHLVGCEEGKVTAVYKTGKCTYHFRNTKINLKFGIYATSSGSVCLTTCNLGFPVAEHTQVIKCKMCHPVLTTDPLKECCYLKACLGKKNPTLNIENT